MYLADLPDGPLAEVVDNVKTLDLFSTSRMFREKVMLMASNPHLTISEDRDVVAAVEQFNWAADVLKHKPGASLAMTVETRMLNKLQYILHTCTASNALTKLTIRSLVKPKFLTKFVGLRELTIDASPVDLGEVLNGLPNLKRLYVRPGIRLQDLGGVRPNLEAVGTLFGPTMAMDPGLEAGWDHDAEMEEFEDDTDSEFHDEAESEPDAETDMLDIGGCIPNVKELRLEVLNAPVWMKLPQLETIYADDIWGVDFTSATSLRKLVLTSRDSINTIVQLDLANSNFAIVLDISHIEEGEAHEDAWEINLDFPLVYTLRQLGPRLSIAPKYPTDVVIRLDDDEDVDTLAEGIQLLATCFSPDVMVSIYTEVDVEANAELKGVIAQAFHQMPSVLVSSKDNEYIVKNGQLIRTM